MKRVPITGTYISSIAKESVTTVKEILRNERLVKHLWIEFILNPEMAKVSKLHLDNLIVKDALTDALSWYLAFRWLLPKNTVLEELHKKKIIVSYVVRDDIYRQKRHSFLKGILYAKLC